MSEFLHGVEIIELDNGTRPIKTVKSSVIGLVGTAPKGPVNVPTLIMGSKKDAVETFGPITEGFTIPQALDAIFNQTGAMVVVINIADPEYHVNEENELDPSLVTMGDVVGGVGSNGQNTGVQALLSAQTEVKVKPRLLIAPGFTHERPEGNANPVIAALNSVADTLKAIVIADCPNSNDKDVIAHRSDWGTPRLFEIYPWVKVYDKKTDTVTEVPASAHVAGLIAKSDNERGFWWSPSNMIINGIVGISKPIDFVLGEGNCKANYWNSLQITTIIQEDGYRLWGNRTTSSDPKWSFLSVRRTADMINDSILRAHMWAIDRNITKTYIEDVCEGVRAYLRQLQSEGAILGGDCWVDSSINTAENIKDGKVVFDFDFTPPYPAEHVTFRSSLVDNYITEIFK